VFCIYDQQLNEAFRSDDPTSFRVELVTVQERRKTKLLCFQSVLWVIDSSNTTALSKQDPWEDCQDQDIRKVEAEP
jgi:hypothetical protein